MKKKQRARSPEAEPTPKTYKVQVRTEVSEPKSYKLRVPTKTIVKRLIIEGTPAQTRTRKR